MHAQRAEHLLRRAAHGDLPCGRAAKPRQGAAGLAVFACGLLAEAGRHRARAPVSARVGEYARGKRGRGGAASARAAHAGALRRDGPHRRDRHAKRLLHAPVAHLERPYLRRHQVAVGVLGRRCAQGDARGRDLCALVCGAGRWLCAKRRAGERRACRTHRKGVCHEPPLRGLFRYARCRCACTAHRRTAAGRARRDGCAQAL